ncbi:hypothetical protein MCSF7_02171 [Mycoplasmopsis columbina SF7]|uniref:Uncharacterized protein n=1 Tax=Mycoplasmopsis columbina SF7 TaxID=1037410 RepID=F9UKM1_9BACT|nr:hypothetical protein [Mycoplasmopsis columbina]EGV00226.1 hypothetical protein MCSF7_02171 [Mycoplasmopsis columbina SF7]
MHFQYIDQRSNPNTFLSLTWKKDQTQQIDYIKSTFEIDDNKEILIRETNFFLFINKNSINDYKIVKLVEHYYGEKQKEEMKKELHKFLKNNLIF